MQDRLDREREHQRMLDNVSQFKRANEAFQEENQKIQEQLQEMTALYLKNKDESECQTTPFST